MSVKYFCDRCSKEVTSKPTERLTLTAERFMVDCIVAVDGVWNNGCVCHDCVRELIAASATPAPAPDPVVDQ